LTARGIPSNFLSISSFSRIHPGWWMIIITSCHPSLLFPLNFQFSFFPHPAKNRLLFCRFPSHHAGGWSNFCYLSGLLLGFLLLPPALALPEGPSCIATLDYICHLPLMCPSNFSPREAPLHLRASPSLTSVVCYTINRSLHTAPRVVPVIDAFCLFFPRPEPPSPGS